LVGERKISKHFRRLTLEYSGKSDHICIYKTLLAIFSLLVVAIVGRIINLGFKGAFSTLIYVNWGKTQYTFLNRYCIAKKIKNKKIKTCRSCSVLSDGNGLGLRLYRKLQLVADMARLMRHLIFTAFGFKDNMSTIFITTHPTHQSSLGEFEETVPSIKHVVKTMCE